MQKPGCFAFAFSMGFFFFFFLESLVTGGVWVSCSGAGSREAAPLGAGWVLLGLRERMKRSRMKRGRGGAGSAPLPCGSVRVSPAVGVLSRAIQRKKGEKKHTYCGSECSSQPREALCPQENLRVAGGLLPEHKKMDFMGRVRGPPGHPSPWCEKGGCGMAPWGFQEPGRAKSRHGGRC